MREGSPSLEELERVAANSALRGGRVVAVACARATELTVTRKGRANYVTDVDMESQREIIAEIRNAYPRHSILAEESPEAADWSGYTWIVDPVDGTTNFAAGVPFCGVSVAVSAGTQVLAGAVFDPMRGELFTARRSAGARLNGVALRIGPGTELTESLVAFDLGYDPENAGRLLERISRLKTQVGTLRLLGSSVLALCYVAAGRLDGYIHNDLCPWDIAAGALIVSEAGGVAVNHQGAPVSPLDSTVVAAPAKLAGDLLAYLKLE